MKNQPAPNDPMRKFAIKLSQRMKERDVLAAFITLQQARRVARELNLLLPGRAGARDLDARRG